MREFALICLPTPDEFTLSTKHKDVDSLDGTMRIIVCWGRVEIFAAEDRLALQEIEAQFLTEEEARSLYKTQDWSR